jgi:DNA-binding SARP family transcriptional activator
VLNGAESAPQGGGVLTQLSGTQAPWRSGAALAVEPALFERFPYGLALASEGRLLQLNHRARRILLPADDEPGELRCCELICGRLGTVLGGGCIGEWALAADRDLPEVRIDLDGERLQTSAWVTASVLDRKRPLLLFHLRPGRPGDRRRRTRQGWHGDSPGGGGAELQIHALGGFRVEHPSGPLNGEWLQQRCGQLLKLLICERRRALASDRIAEALWPGAGPEEGRNRLRFHIHSLRERLEPERASHAPSRFVSARRGGYLFDTARVWVDADEFEREARAGLAAIEHPGGGDSALAHLRCAGGLYRGDFMAEDPYAEWALKERERLRDLAGRSFRACAELHLRAGDAAAALPWARRLAELEPFDDEAQRPLVELCLRTGRRSEALRRYELHRSRTRRLFGAEPAFDLATLEASEVAVRGAQSRSARSRAIQGSSPL